MSATVNAVASDRPLPSGTVTFLFSDIEGSTQRWETRRDAMRTAVERHDQIVREAITTHGGFVFKTVGDAFCAVFPTAPAAVAAALAAQRALNKEDWSAVNGLAVRVAVHTGDTHERDGDYFGPAVNRVARLLAIGHGGQVLVSGVAAELAQSALPVQVVLRDLGTHRLRDLTHPEQVFQLKAPDLPSEFPALRSLDSLPNNLPLQLTSFIGREAELAEMKELLEKTRLLTLFGAGGVGKTRAAIQLGADLLDAYPDGVWFVDLAPITDGNLIGAELASAMGLQESSEKRSNNILVALLKNSRVLILLDSCEHIISAVAEFTNALLHGCPKLKIVATTREALGITGESVYRMPSLECPLPGVPLTVEQATKFAAIALFADRAHAADNKFALSGDNVMIVADICRRLDGIALAIELAAPRVKVLNVKQIAERLDERFRILTSGSRTALPRQQTMRALIDWSYNLLPSKEQQLFRMLSIFAGGWTLEAATAVCAIGELEDFEVLDGLSALVDKSLVHVEFTETSQRYKMLESMRHYGLEKLQQAGERQTAERRRADYFAELARRCEDSFSIVPTYAVRAQLQPELDNFRATLDWALVKAADMPLGQRLVAAVGLCVNAGFTAPESVHWIQLALKTIDESTPVRVQADLWAALSYTQAALFLHTDAGESGLKTLELCRAVNDPLAIARAKSRVGRSLCFTGHQAQGKKLLEEAVVVLRELNLPKLIGDCLESLGTAAVLENDIAASRAYYREALPMVQSVGDERKVAVIYQNKAETEFQAGNIPEALEFNAQSLVLDRAQKNLGSVANALTNRSAYHTANGQPAESLHCTREAMHIAHEAQLATTITWNVLHHAAVAETLGQRERAARLLGFVQAHMAELKIVFEYTEQQEFDKLVRVLPPSLGEEAFRQLIDEGKLWNEDRAVAEAFEIAI